MIRTLVVAAALTCATCLTPAFAQNGGMINSGYQMTARDALASKLIGTPIYSTVATKNNGNTAPPANNAAGGMAPAGNAAASAATANNVATPNGANAQGATSGVANTATDTNAEQIGKINDLVLDTDGQVKAVVIGIGGVLGIGEKNVAVAYSDIAWQVANDGSVRGMLATTADELKNAPDFKYPSGGQPTKVGENQANAQRSAGSGPAPAGSTTPNTAAPAAGAAAGGMAAAPAPANNGNTAAEAAPAQNNAANQTPAASMDPQNFANTAAMSNMFEIQSSQLALKQTQNKDVLDFANKMITDHTKAGQDMQAAAEKQQVTVPTQLDQTHQQQLQQLQGLKDQQFDQAYIQMQLAGHQQAVQLFQQYSQSGPDGDLKTFATQTLPTLQSHLDMIQKLSGK
jgi:putative membrane protein